MEVCRWARWNGLWEGSRGKGEGVVGFGNGEGIAFLIASLFALVAKSKRSLELFAKLHAT